MDNQILEIIQSVLESSDIQHSNGMSEDFLEKLIDVSIDNGIDISNYSIEELQSAIEYAVNHMNPHIVYGNYYIEDIKNIDYKNAAEYFANVANQPVYNIEPAITSIEGLEYKNTTVPESIKKNLIISTIDMVNKTHYGSIGNAIQPVEQRIGFNMGTFINKSGVTFGGIKELLKLNSYNMQVLTENVANSVIDASSSRTIDNNFIQNVFNKMLSILGIK